MATKLYAFWKLSGNPPSPWSKVATYDGKYMRGTSDVANALTTGGNSTHTHSLGTGHTIGTTNDATSLLNTVGVDMLCSLGTGHNHAIGTVAMASANNTPPYYTYSLISIDLATFMSTQKKLPTGAVVASTEALSTTGYSRVTVADGKLIIFGSTPGLNSSTLNHSHGFTGALSNYSGVNPQAVYGDTAFLRKASNQNHNHGVSTLTSSSVSMMPARIQTRLYEVTSDPYGMSIPVGAVLFADGSITDYDGTFEILTDWDNRFIESANSNATQTGADDHNHGDSATGTSDGPNIPGYNSDTRSDRCMRASHTHSLTVKLSTSNVSHVPPYVYLTPIKVKTEIIAEQTFTKTYAMDALLKKTTNTSYGMSISLFQPGTKYYNMDLLIKKGGLTKSANLDIMIAKRTPKTYTADLLIKRTGMSISYQMGMAPLFLKGKRYEMGIRLIAPGAIPRYSVIDTLQDSWIAQYNKFIQAVESSRVSLKIETASGYDLERRWGRAFNLPRDPDETDTHYRARLMSYMSSIIGCGTKPAIEAALNIATGGDNARVDVFPGLIRVNFDTDFQRRAAKERQTAIEKILNFSVAAGVQWVLYLPYIDYSMDILLKKGTLTKGYNVDVLLQKQAIALDYAMDIVLCSVNTKPYDMDMLLMKHCSKTYRMFMRLKKIGLKPYNMDVRLKKKNITKSIDMDMLLMKHCSKSYHTKIILQKFGIMKNYSMRMRLMAVGYRTYQMGFSLQAKFLKAYNMDILLSLHRFKTYTMDILLAEEVHKTYSMDLLIKRYNVAKNYTMDILLANENSVSFDMDVVLKKTVAKPYSMDILVKKTLDISYNMDIRMKTVRVKSYVMDLYLKLRALKKSYTMDLMLKHKQSKAYTMDVILTRRRLRSIAMDILVKRGSLLKTYSMSVLLASQVSKSYTMDLQLKKSIVAPYDADILLQKQHVKPFTVDVVLAKRIGKSYQMDIYLMKKAQLKAYAMDLQLKKTIRKTYTADLLICRHSILKTYSMGLKIGTLWKRLNYRMDILLKKAMSKSYQMDIYLMKKAQLKAYAMDLQLKKAHVRPYGADLFLANRKGASYGMNISLSGSGA